MKPAIKKIFTLLALAFFLFQCSEPEQAEHAHAEEEAHDEHGGEEGNENSVELSEVQLAAIELQYGSLDTLNISGFVKATGTLDLPPPEYCRCVGPYGWFC